MRTIVLFAVCVCLAAKEPKEKKLSSIDRWIEQAETASREGSRAAAAGSLYTGSGPLADLSRDFRASQAGDLVTIVVSDRASAVSKGTSTSARKSSATASVTAALGPLKVPGRTAPLGAFGGDSQLDGQGQTTRQNTVTTTISARVTHVLPNGYLVVEGAKQIGVNSEVQTVRVRGVLRPIDLSSANTINSDRLAELEVQVNGRGVVGDAVRRPFILYRILMGLLPF